MILPVRRPPPTATGLTPPPAPGPHGRRIDAAVGRGPGPGKPAGPRPTAGPAHGSLPGPRPLASQQDRLRLWQFLTNQRG